MLFLPIEFNKVKIEASVNSGAHINAISERDAEKIGHEADQFIIKKAPPPPFKVQLANAELEHSLPTYTLRFKIGDYSFAETFLIMTQTWFPIIWLAFLRKQFAILDNAQGTIDFPKIQITMALTNEMQNFNPNPITVKTESKHTIPAQFSRVIHASIAGGNDYPLTGTVQLLPQFDECAKFIVAPAITSARDKSVIIKIAFTTVSPNTELAELQTLKPEETKSTRTVDIAALNLLTKHAEVVTYINALMQVERPDDNESKFRFPTPESRKPR